MLAANRPCDACIAVGVASIELVPIVEPHRDLERLGRSAAPFEDFLRPIHSHVACIRPLRTICRCGRSPLGLPKSGEIDLEARNEHQKDFA